MPNARYDLTDAIARRELRLSVIGLGYVGLPLALAFAEAGLRVVGVDVDAAKIAAINAGQSYIGDVSAETVAAVVDQGKLSATADFSALRDADAVIICVPTPLSKTRDPDISYIISAADEIARYIHPGRAWPAPIAAWARISSWRFRPGGLTRATSATRCATRPK